MLDQQFYIHQLLKSYFGFSSFRPFQEQIIKAILSNHDCLAIMPTGGGKSLCFQIPGLAIQGTTVVVSPLISLMQDQVHQLKSRHIAAVMLSSSLSKEARLHTIEEIKSGEITFVYVSPEQLLTKR
jgi:ATP-dependent DNA helicase RecQ